MNSYDSFKVPARFKTVYSFASQGKLSKIFNSNDPLHGLEGNFFKFCDYLADNQNAEPGWFDVIFSMIKIFKVPFLKIIERAFNRVQLTPDLWTKLENHGLKLISFIDIMMQQIKEQNSTINKKYGPLDAYGLFTLKQINFQIKQSAQHWTKQDFQSTKLTQSQLKIYSFIHKFKYFDKKVFGHKWKTEELQHIPKLEEEKQLIDQEILQSQNPLIKRFFRSQMEFYSVALIRLKSKCQHQLQKILLCQNRNSKGKNRRKFQTKRMARSSKKRKYFQSQTTDQYPVKLMNNPEKECALQKALGVEDSETHFEESLEQGQMSLSDCVIVFTKKRKFKHNTRLEGNREDEFFGGGNYKQASGIFVSNWKGKAGFNQGNEEESIEY